MSETSTDEPMHGATRGDVWRALLARARQYRGRFAIVTVLAAASAAAGLVEPLVYRVVVNDIAGVFVGHAAEQPDLYRALFDEQTPSTVTPPVAQPPAKTEPRPKEPSHKRHVRHASHARHQPGQVAPRSVSQMFDTLLWAVGVLLVTGLAAQLFEVMADNRAAATANRIEEEFINSTFRHAMRLRLRFFGPQSSAGLTKQIDQSDQVAPILMAFAKDILPEGFRLIGTFAILFSQNVPLTAIALATLPIYVAIARRSTRNLESQLPAYFELWEEVSARIRDALGAMKTVKLAGSEAREAEHLAAAAHEAYASYLTRNRLANRYLFWQTFVQRVGQASVLAYGGWAVVEHRLTPGDVVMFASYLDRLYDPIDSLTALANTLQEHVVSLQRALRLLVVDDVEPTGTPLSPGRGRVEFRDVHFSYGAGREVLRGVDFDLEPGKVTALVGPSGAGKTTLADLLLRLHEPTSGTIAIDGQLLSQLDPASVRQAVGVVAADGAIFRGTLADNLRYKCADASDEDVRAAASAAGLDRALARLPDGLASEIGEGGVGLSVGERQRVQLARVIVSQPRILVLDEATANLDYATEAEIRQALATLQRERTTLIIAHRYSMVAQAEEVIVLEDGRVAARGTPEQVRKVHSWFAQFAATAGGDPKNPNPT